MLLACYQVAYPHPVYQPTLWPPLAVSQSVSQSCQSARARARPARRPEDLIDIHSRRYHGSETFCFLISGTLFESTLPPSHARIKAERMDRPETVWRQVVDGERRKREVAGGPDRFCLYLSFSLLSALPCPCNHTQLGFWL